MNHPTSPEPISGLSSLTEKEHSIWLADRQKHIFPELDRSIDTDVAVVGGGIAGVTCAYALQNAGMKVALIEKNTIASGTTGGTTGKITSQHGLIYKKLIENIGQNKAKIYAEAYHAAVNDIQKIIRDENIDCELSHADNYVFTTDQKKVSLFKKEAAAAQSLGLPAVYTNKLSLPMPVRAAVKFTGQAKFDAVKYTRRLAKIVEEKGAKVFENSGAQKIKDGERCYIKTAKGSIAAKHIVVASKIPPFPLAARFTYAAYEYPETSYLIAGDYEGQLNGMYISPDSEHGSILPFTLEGKNYLLIGGQNHIPGLGFPKNKHKKLAAYAERWFDIRQVSYRWKAMDYIAYDDLPLIGKMYPWSKNMYVVSGFKKWGLSASAVAAKIIRSLLAGVETPESQLFYPHRLSAVSSIPAKTVDYVRSKLDIA